MPQKKQSERVRYDYDYIAPNIHSAQLPAPGEVVVFPHLSPSLGSGYYRLTGTVQAVHEEIVGPDVTNAYVVLTDGTVINQRVKYDTQL